MSVLDPVTVSVLRQVRADPWCTKSRLYYTHHERRIVEELLDLDLLRIVSRDKRGVRVIITPRGVRLLDLLEEAESVVREDPGIGEESPSTPECPEAPDPGE